MPGSEDEAKLCLRLAQNARDEGKLELALGFAEQAKSLHSSPEVDNMLWSLRQQTASQPHYSEPDVPMPYPEPSSSGAMHAMAPPANQSSTFNTLEASPRDAIDHILEVKSNYYQVFGVHKRASNKELRNVYHKLVLKLHPDVCKEPRAQEAFDVVTRAYTTLSDQHRRAVYDLKLRGEGAFLPDEEEEDDSTAKKRKKSKRMGLVKTLIKWWTGGSLIGKLTLISSLIPVFMGFFSWIAYGAVFMAPVYLVAHEIEAFYRRKSYRHLRKVTFIRRFVMVLKPLAVTIVAVMNPVIHLVLSLLITLVEYFKASVTS